MSGPTWRIEEAAGKAVVDPSQTQFRVESDGKVSGSTGCNNFTGSATITGTNVAFSPLATTRKACLPPLGDQETAILGALHSVKSYALADAGHLNLLDAGGQVLLRLRANP